jgi:hypothetical protein
MTPRIAVRIEPQRFRQPHMPKVPVKISVIADQPVSSQAIDRRTVAKLCRSATHDATHPANRPTTPARPLDVSTFLLCRSHDVSPEKIAPSLQVRTSRATIRSRAT